MQRFPDSAWFANAANRRSWDAHLHREYLTQAARNARTGKPLTEAVNLAIDQIEIDMLAEGVPDQIVRGFRQKYLRERQYSLFELAEHLGMAQIDPYKPAARRQIAEIRP